MGKKQKSTSGVPQDILAEDEKHYSIVSPCSYPAPVDTVNKDIAYYSTLKVISTSLVVILALPVLVILAPGFVTAASVFPLAVLCLILSSSSTLLGFLPSVARTISPRQYARLQNEHLVNERFYQLKMLGSKEVQETHRDMTVDDVEKARVRYSPADALVGYSLGVGIPELVITPTSKR